MCALDILDLIIQIQSFVPIFKRKHFQFVSRLWYDAYFLSMKIDNSDFTRASNWWKSKKTDKFGVLFDPQCTEYITLAYSDKIFGEVCYHKQQSYLLLVSRAFKLSILLMRWEIFPKKIVDCLFFDSDNQLNMYLGQSCRIGGFLDCFVTDAILINLDTYKITKYNNFFHSIPSNAMKLYQFEKPIKHNNIFHQNGPRENFVSRMTSELLKLGTSSLTTVRESSEGIEITLWRNHRTIIIPLTMKLISVTYYHQNIFILIQMKGKFFTIWVDNFVSFCNSAVFFDQSQQDMIDSNGRKIYGTILDFERQNITILDSSRIEYFLTHY